MISVLCVDDEPGLLNIAKIFLERDEDLRVKTATSALEGLSALSADSFDAIVSDYQMPDMDGIEFLKRVRSLDGVPFILFTGKGREEVAIEAINNGVDFYLQKGGEPKSQFTELVHKIKHAVNKRRTELLLLQSEQKFRTFADYTHDWEYWESPDSGFVYITPSCEQITGYTADEFNQDPDLMNRIIHPEDRGIWQDHRNNAENTQKMLSVDFRIVRKDGSTRWISHQCQLVSDPDGRPQGRRAGNRDITGRRQVEDKLYDAYQKLTHQDQILKQQYGYLKIIEAMQNQNSRFLDDVLSSIQDGISILDKDMTILKVNTTMERWYAGAMPLVGRKCYEAYHCQTSPCDICPTLRSFESGTVSMDILPRPASENEPAGWLELYSFPLIDSQTGERSGAIEYLRDITDRRKTQELLRESEARLRSIFRVAPIGIGMVSDRVLLEVNDRICLMTGYSPDELLGKSARIFYPTQEEFDRVGGEKYAEIEGTGSGPIETRWKKKDGTIIDIQLASTPIDPENLPSGVTFTALDITKSKHAEHALQDSESKYRELIENADVIIIKIDRNGTITFFNEYAQKFFGYSEQELLGRPIIGTIVPATESTTGRDLEFIIRDVFLHPEQYEHHENESLKKSGEHVWIAWRNKPIVDGEGKITEMISFGTDITERRKAEEALFQANKKLNLLNAITRHDILNQLTVLSGYIEMSKAAAKDEMMREYITLEKRATGAIQRMISFTKDYQDVGLYRPLWQDLHTIVRLLAKTVDIHTVNLVIDLNRIEVYADPLLEKVVYTLLENALRHGGTLTTIRFSYEMTDKGCRIICEDDGAGIPDDDKEKIFERGYGKHTGFGLFLTREILGITGFTIKETGKSGKGARFEIFVPNGAFRIPEKP